MTVLQLTLGESPSSVACGQAKITEKRSNEREIAAMQTLRNIQQTLQKVRTEAIEHHAELQKQIATIAVRVVESIIEAEADHVQQLARAFAQAACDGLEPAVPQCIYVHPRCEATIQEWMQDSGVDLTMKLDPNVPPGDCIVEAGQQGVAASLDSYLEASILEQTKEISETLEQARGAS